jgi:hypothetical protein
MDAQAVRTRRRLLDDQLAEAQAEVDKVLADMRALKRQCEHTNARRTSHMGESCHHCYDCGSCDV